MRGRTISAEMLRIVLDHERTCHGYNAEYRTEKYTDADKESYRDQYRRARELSDWVIDRIKWQYGDGE